MGSGCCSDRWECKGEWGPDSKFTQMYLYDLDKKRLLARAKILCAEIILLLWYFFYLLGLAIWTKNINKNSITCVEMSEFGVKKMLTKKVINCNMKPETFAVTFA